MFHRVHCALYGATEFHPGITGNARFSPMRNKAGEPIPTLYGGASFECAAMETVFHDVPFTAGFKAYDKSKLNGHLHSQVGPKTDLVLADLGSKALRKLGIERKQLIDTEKDQYPVTRLWAEAIHGECPDVQACAGPRARTTAPAPWWGPLRLDQIPVARFWASAIVQT